MSEINLYRRVMKVKKDLRHILRRCDYCKSSKLTLVSRLVTADKGVLHSGADEQQVIERCYPLNLKLSELPEPPIPLSEIGPIPPPPMFSSPSPTILTRQRQQQVPLLDCEDDGESFQHSSVPICSSSHGIIDAAGRHTKSYFILCKDISYSIERCCREI